MRFVEMDDVGKRSTPEKRKEFQVVLQSAEVVNLLEVEK